MTWRRLLWVIVAGVLVGFAFYAYQSLRPRLVAGSRLAVWLSDPQAHPEWSLHAGTRCGSAPFVFPTDGFVGYRWDEVFSGGHHHQGIDIFGGQGPDVTRVVAASAGYITRLDDWKSALIERIPSDPLQPGTQIWLYYTHMADAAGNSFIVSAFPPGTVEKYVDAGTLLGFQGDYTGDPESPTGVHLHFSVVRDDGQGHFLNELDIQNTYDPSPYLGLALNADMSGSEPVVCAQQ